MNNNRFFSPLSLRLRLTLFISIITIAIFLATSWFVERSVEQHFIEQDVAELTLIQAAIRDVILSYDTPLSPNTPQSETLEHAILQILKNHPDYYYVWLSEPNSTTAIYQSKNSLDWQAILQQPTPPRVQIWQQHDQNYRLMIDILPAPSSTLLKFMIATPINFHLHYIHRLQTTFLLISIISSLILLLAAWIAVYQGHAPIRHLSRHIANLTTDQLDIRLNQTNYPIELRELVQSFNRLMTRIEDVFQRQANFSADIAHEIRTPITNLTTQTQIVLSQPRTKEDYQEILYSNLEEYERMRKMVNDMLFLAQVDSQLLSLDLIEMQLDKEWLILFDDFAAWSEEQHLTLKLTGHVPTILGDRAMLRRAFSNLLANAIKHTQPHQTILVDLQLDDDNQHAKIIITNPHDTIPPQQLAHLFDRFYRLDPARRHQSDSVGIGLAIVKSIIQLHQGKITAHSHENNICFSIYLPLKQP